MEVEKDGIPAEDARRNRAPGCCCRGRCGDIARSDRRDRRFGDRGGLLTPGIAGRIPAGAFARHGARHRGRVSARWSPRGLPTGWPACPRGLQRLGYRDDRVRGLLPVGYLGRHARRWAIEQLHRLVQPGQRQRRGMDVQVGNLSDHRIAAVAGCQQGHLAGGERRGRTVHGGPVRPDAGDLPPATVRIRGCTVCAASSLRPEMADPGGYERCRWLQRGRHVGPGQRSSVGSQRPVSAHRSAHREQHSTVDLLRQW
ncbi:Uncharacterised protein [Mycobacteroides abscessus subsp. abscessus]|nr:Uncharacterised protein [Mycobacteroides abscessus subsp. abscessus]